ncbi:hypothetical protein J6590_009992 [Homalodisca vitripennis]|nr:hypothetical protein J6590_009992 [Homalodisca vitripennis]
MNGWDSIALHMKVGRVRKTRRDGRVDNFKGISEREDQERPSKHSPYEVIVLQHARYGRIQEGL